MLLCEEYINISQFVKVYRLNSVIFKSKNMNKNKPRLLSLKKHYIKIALFIAIFSIFLIVVTDKDDDSIDYNNRVNWVSLPSITKNVDVFYVYPTVSSDTTGSMDITDSTDRALAKGIFDAQASVFDSTTNIFAPFYRQMSTNVDMSEDTLVTDTEEFKRGAADVQDAFDYYIENINNNRPFIIAGHSQGTMALIELIQNRFGNNPILRSRLVAAYLIGYTVTDSILHLSGLSAAQDSADLGVVITYNSQSVTSEGGPMLMEGANCINPLNWKTDNTPADSLENLGAVFFNDSTGVLIREVKHYCGAQIDTLTGALTTTIPPGDTLDIGPYSEGVYHRFDYSFWYRNLEKNVDDRIKAYFKNNSSLKHYKTR